LPPRLAIVEREDHAAVGRRRNADEACLDGRDIGRTRARRDFFRRDGALRQAELLLRVERRGRSAAGGVTAGAAAMAGRTAAAGAAGAQAAGRLGNPRRRGERRRFPIEAGQPRLGVGNIAARQQPVERRSA